MSEVTTGSVDRRGFLRKGLIAGVGVAAVAGLPGSALARTMRPASALTTGDVAISRRREIAEALAVTTYTNIIETRLSSRTSSPTTRGTSCRPPGGDVALPAREGRQEAVAVQGVLLPDGHVPDAQTTLNTLVTLEDAFIAAYLVGVRDFSTADLRVTAARIMGIESDHRTLARVVGPGVAKKDGGPVEAITGVLGKAESVDPPNNNGYERTLKWTNINQAVTALMPFIDKTAAGKAGFDTTKAYAFNPFTPKLPNPLGAFHSFAG